MPFAQYRDHFLLHKEKYLPYLYPILMPILTMYSSRAQIHSLQNAVIYWLFVGFIQWVLLVLTQKIIYSAGYHQKIRWLLAFFVGSVVVFFYIFLDCHFFHVVERFQFPNKWGPVMRFLLNIPIFIALLESIKSASKRRKILVNNAMLENENAIAQLHLLLQQVNPHFLFNCLTVLLSMTRAKDVRTDSFIEKMGELYRQSLENNKGAVTVQEELNFFNAYLYLMCLRHENAIFVDIKVSDESLTYHLPTFSLQLLAENCIKHNIVSEAKPLYIRLYQKDPKSLTVSNNYQPKTQKNESFGIGITNLKKRYSLEGIEQGVTIQQDEIHYETTLKLF